MTGSEASTATSGLLRRFAAGDLLAFVPLYRKLAPGLFVWASLRIPARIRHRIDPEDVVQEVWYRAVRRLDSFDASRAGFRSWVFGIANLTLRAELRKIERRARALPLAELPHESLGDAADEATSIVRQVARSEAIGALLAAAQALDDESRALLLYRGLEGLPHAEVARRLGISPEAAEIRWRRLCERLRVDLLPSGWVVGEG